MKRNRQDAQRWFALWGGCLFGKSKTAFRHLALFACVTLVHYHLSPRNSPDQSLMLLSYPMLLLFYSPSGWEIFRHKIHSIFCVCAVYGAFVIWWQYLLSKIQRTHICKFRIGLNHLYLFLQMSLSYFCV